MLRARPVSQEVKVQCEANTWESAPGTPSVCPHNTPHSKNSRPAKPHSRGKQQGRKRRKKTLPSLAKRCQILPNPAKSCHTKTPNPNPAPLISTLANSNPARSNPTSGAAPRLGLFLSPLCGEVQAGAPVPTWTDRIVCPTQCRLRDQNSGARAAKN
jgi:hypothetical protein